MENSASDVLSFWADAGPKRWFTKDDAFDRDIEHRFSALVSQAEAGTLANWGDEPESALALIIVLDQFTRNLHRGSGDAFRNDPAALAIANEAIRRGHDRSLGEWANLRGFFYMPFMHSEKLADQERCIALFREMGSETSLHHAEVHADIIRRFGRFPHRNAVLGRTSSPDEIAFLDAGGFAG